MRRNPNNPPPGCGRPPLSPGEPSVTMAWLRVPQSLSTVLRRINRNVIRAWLATMVSRRTYHTPTDGWIAVDLDGTLAEYHGWPKDGSIGPPVPTMVRRVRAWLAEGREVRIFTARVSESREYSAESGRYADLRFVMEQREKIREWCQKHIGTVLPVTCEKDFRLAEIWDDRSVRVECNTGREL